MIGKELTKNQQTVIDKWIRKNSEIVQQYGEVSKMREAMKFDILNPQCFQKTGNDFRFKFNTLVKAIREHRWVPQNYLDEKKQQQTSHLMRLKQRIREIEADKHQHKTMRADPTRANHTEFLELCDRVIKRSEEKLKPLYEKLAQLTKAKGKEMCHQLL